MIEQPSSDGTWGSVEPHIMELVNAGYVPGFNAGKRQNGFVLTWKGYDVIDRAKTSSVLPGRLT